MISYLSLVSDLGILGSPYDSFYEFKPWHIISYKPWHILSFKSWHIPSFKS